MSVQHIRCAPGATLGEEIAAEFIRNAFQQQAAALLTNFHHPNGRGAGTDEIDLVLINERGVWLLETKHWYGRIVADPVDWFQAGRRHPSPIRGIEMKARRVGTTVRTLGFDNVSTSGLVVLTTSEQDSILEIDDPLKDKVLRLDDSLVRAVNSDRFLFHRNNRRLSAAEIGSLAQGLTRMKVDPQRQIIGSYRLLREIERGEMYTAFEAQHADVGRRARVKRYELTGLEKIPDMARAAKRFQQDMRALIAVEGHPNVVRAYDFLPDPDTSTTSWLFLEWVDGPTLADLMGRRTFAFQEQLLLLLPLARAIDFCHRKGIIHRNINPASVYLARDGSVKLGDFDFARVPAAGTISVQGQPLTLNAYTAPEIRSDASAAAERSDLYSLGVVWYDLVLRRKPEESVLLSAARQAAIPEPARELLTRLLAPRPEGRPASAAEVVQLFQQFVQR